MGGRADAGVGEHRGRNGLAAKARLPTLGREQCQPGHVRAGLGDCQRKVGGAVQDTPQLRVASVASSRAPERRERLLPGVRAPATGNGS